MEPVNELPEGSIPLAGSLDLDQKSSDADLILPSSTKSIEVELPDGRKIGLARPSVSISMNLANILSEIDFKSPLALEMERARVKCLLYITSIDGEDEPKIADPIMRRALEQKIGEEYLDGLIVVCSQNFPSSDPDKFKVVKKS